jgi:hypothetical protein
MSPEGYTTKQVVRKLLACVLPVCGGYLGYLFATTHGLASAAWTFIAIGVAVGAVLTTAIAQLVWWLEHHPGD